MARIFAIMSGKGGVGKSTLAAALAEYYASEGLKVALLDGDTGLRCADLMLGLQDRVVYDLGDVVENRCGLNQALVSSPQLENLSLLAAPQLMKPSDVKAKEMAKIIARLSARHDLVILDAPAGIGRGLKNLLGANAQSILVATPDDVSIRDAERLSVLLAERGEMHPGLILNRVSKKLVKTGEMLPPEQLAAALDLPLMGILPESKHIYRALLRHETALHCQDKQVLEAIEIAASRLLGADTPLPEYAPSPVWRFFSRGGEFKA